jgi:diguanylate cyclase (GGDEF)-like protein
LDILVVDDDQESTESINRFLDRLGYNVVSCQDGAGAWEVLQSNNTPSLVLLNQVVPGMDGIELCQRIREMDREYYFYVILLGSKTGKENFIDGMEAGADDYLTKPVDPQELRVRLRAGMRIIELNRELVESHKSLRNIATHDLLTGLLNRKAVLQALQRETERCFREKKNFCLTLLDLDGFKRVNESVGNDGGDHVLKEVARYLQANLRTYDSIGRYGEEEFLVILTGCDLEDARQNAERLRRRIGDQPIQTPLGSVSVTASIGISHHDKDHKADAESLLRMAEKSLAGAKREGGNRVHVPTEGP